MHGSSRGYRRRVAALFGVRNWKLWTLRWPVRLYVVAVEAATLAVVVWSVTVVGTTGIQWVLCGVLAAAALVHLHLSRAIELVRRDHSHTPHVDLCSVWIFAGAVVLSPLAVTLLTAGIYAHRWWLVGRWDAGRTPHRVVFTATTMVLGALAVVGIVEVSGFRDTVLGHQPVDWVGGVVLVGAMGTQWMVNTVLVAIAIRLTAKVSRRWEAIGGLSDNILEVGQLVLGAFVALAAAQWPGLAPLMIVPVIALHRTVLLHQLQLASRTDDKTGLLNATTWHQQTGVELHRARQQSGSLAVLMIDLDLFSEVNNRYGHLAGDAVLRTVAHLLTSTLRRGDAVGRFGGEEFTVLLPGVDRQQAQVVAERIRHRMHEVRVADGAGGVITGLSVSIGAAVYPDIDEDTVDGLLAAADTALYGAKNNGRDQVRVAGEHRVVPRPPADRRPAAAEDGT